MLCKPLTLDFLKGRFLVSILDTLQAFSNSLCILHMRKLRHGGLRNLTSCCNTGVGAQSLTLFFLGCFCFHFLSLLDGEAWPATSVVVLIFLPFKKYFLFCLCFSCGTNSILTIKGVKRKPSMFYLRDCFHRCCFCLVGRERMWKWRMSRCKASSLFSFFKRSFLLFSQCILRCQSMRRKKLNFLILFPLSHSLEGAIGPAVALERERRREREEKENEKEKEKGGLPAEEHCTSWAAPTTYCTFVLLCRNKHCSFLFLFGNNETWTQGLCIILQLACWLLKQVPGITPFQL